MVLRLTAHRQTVAMMSSQYNSSVAAPHTVNNGATASTRCLGIWEEDHKPS